MKPEIPEQTHDAGPVAFRLRLDGVSKRFRLASESTSTGRGVEIWALRDITFDVPPGSILGVVGVPGAGRSTLLRVIAGLSRQTEGQIHGNGRLVSFLELARGMDKSLTVRQNLMSESLFGVPGLDDEDEISQVLEEAEVAAAINDRLENQDKSELQRLLFSAAVHSAPDIIVAEKSLLVGQGEFREHALDRLLELVDGGTSIVYAGKSVADMERLCDRAIWLDGGRVREIGESGAVIRRYRAFESQGPTIFDIPKLQWSNDVSREAEGDVPAEDESAGTVANVPAEDESAGTDATVVVLSRGIERRTIAWDRDIELELRLAVDDTDATLIVGVEIFADRLVLYRGGAQLEVRDDASATTALAIPGKVLPPGMYRVVAHFFEKSTMDGEGRTTTVKTKFTIEPPDAGSAGAARNEIGFPYLAVSWRTSGGTFATTEGPR